MKILKVALFICIMHDQIDAVVKTLVNNSSKNMLVRIYDKNNHIIGIDLAPGAIQDVFIPCDSIDKLSVIDKKHLNKTFKSMTHNELRKETSPINDHMIFIIEKNYAIKMYKGSTTRDAMLQEIDQDFVHEGKIPTIELSIHAIKGDKAWTGQKVTYNLKHKTSFTEAIKSVFA